MRLGQWFGIIALVASLYILWRLRAIVLLVFTAVVLATAINQLVRRFQRGGLQRGWAVFLSLGSILLFLVLAVGLIVPPFVDQFQDLVTLFPLALDQVQFGLDWLQDRILGPNFPELPNANAFLRQFYPYGMNLVRQAIAFFTNSITALLETILVLALTIMLLSNPQPYRNAFVRCFPSFYRARVREILDHCAEGLGNWTQGALIEMLFIGILSGLGLWLLRVPLVMAHAVLAGLLNFIPNIGPTLSVIIPMTIGFLDAPWKALAVLILYILLQNIESYWLTPTVMANQVSLLPAITLSSQILFTALFGALGLLMALPLTVVTKTWIEEALFKDVMDQWQQASSR